MSGPVVDAERDGEDDDIDGDSRRAARQMREASLGHGFSMPVASAECGRVGPAAVEPWAFRRRTVTRLLPALKPCVWKADPKAGNGEMLEPAMFIGLGAGGRLGARPLSAPAARFARAGGRARRGLVRRVRAPAGDARASCCRSRRRPSRGRTSRCAPHPALTYVLLSWVWLIARILHDLLGARLAAATPFRASLEAGFTATTAAAPAQS